MAASSESPIFVDALGCSMWLNDRDRALSPNIRRHRVWEPLQTQVVWHELGTGETAVDIGANVGYYTLLFAKCVGDSGRVFSFEPEPTNFGFLQRNVALNGFQTVVLAQQAVSDRSGTLGLHLSELNLGTHTLARRHSAQTSLAVETVRLDDALASCRVDFIKMDIEGAEGDALRGMDRVLTRNPQCRILTEFSPSGLAAFGTDPVGFAASLSGRGLRLHVLDEHEQDIRAVEPADLAEYEPGEDRFTNLFCTPGEWRWDWLRAWRRTWDDRRTHVREALGGLLTGAETVILVDDQTLGEGILPEGCRGVPFLEHEGAYWGTPLDDSHAIRELERLRRAGADLAVVCWPSFWWLDFYPAFGEFLGSRFTRVLENDQVVAFDLRPGGGDQGGGDSSP